MRWGRRLGRLGLGLTLLACVAWGVSLWWGVRCELGRVGVNLYDGSVGCWWVTAPDGRGQGLRIEPVTLRSRSWIPRPPLAFSNPREACVVVPLWLCISVFAGLSGLLFWAGRKVRPGFCARCGYDLRGTRERCPECGQGAANSE